MTGTASNPTSLRVTTTSGMSALAEQPAPKARLATPTARSELPNEREDEKRDETDLANMVLNSKTAGSRSDLHDHAELDRGRDGVQHRVLLDLDGGVALGVGLDDRVELVDRGAQPAHA